MSNEHEEAILRTLLDRRAESRTVQTPELISELHAISNVRIADALEAIQDSLQTISKQGPSDRG